DARDPGDAADPQGCPHARGCRPHPYRGGPHDGGPRPSARPRAQAAAAPWPDRRGSAPDHDLVGEDREACRQDRGTRIRQRGWRAGRRQRDRGAAAAPARSGRMMAPIPARPRATFAETLAVYLRPRVLVVMFLGFSSGLPLALSGSTLQIWMAQSGVDIRTIGLFAAIGTPYTIKFLWAPLVDALDVPVLSRLLGRRRGWLLMSQLLLPVAIVLLGLNDPASAPWL